MVDITHFINICPTIFIQVLHMHDFVIYFDDDFQIIFLAWMKKSYVGTWVHF